MANKLTLRLKLVTPLFIGGSQNKLDTYGVRVPSIRGNVRYWLRALLGRQHGGNQTELKKAEDYLLGSTGSGSPVWFRVSTTAPLLVNKRRMLPHREISQLDPGSRRKPPLAQDAFVENQTFDLIVQPRPGLYTIPDKAVAALLLWLNLGGLGKRARRGFGSLQLVGATGLEAVSADARRLFQQTGFADATELRQHVGSVITWAAGLIPPAHSFSGLAPYPILSEAAYNYGLKQTEYWQAMVPFWVESLRNKDKGIKHERAFGYAVGKKRRASPFHLHIAETNAGHHLVLTTFWARPEPDPGWERHMNSLLSDCQTTWGAKTVWGKVI